tara:strand:+ start:1734 stop:1847 length:114 start_codon:yes stop_codon:yes gene_type:complete
MNLCNENILKLDDVTKLGIEKSFTYMSYLRDKESIKK